MRNAVELKISRELPVIHMIGAWVCWPVFGQIVDGVTPEMKTTVVTILHAD